MEARYKNICPACGGTTAVGELSLGSKADFLQWCAARKIPRKHPIGFLKSEVFHQREVKVRLMGSVFSFSGADVPGYVLAWYCPNCKKVFAWFDAPSVPPELCDAETTKQTEGVK